MKSDPNWGRADNVQGYRPLSNRVNEGFELNDEEEEEVEDVERGRTSQHGGASALGSVGFYLFLKKCNE